MLATSDIELYFFHTAMTIANRHVAEVVQGGLRAAPTSASSFKKPRVAVLGGSSLAFLYSATKNGVLLQLLQKQGMVVLGLQQGQSC